MHIIVVGCGRVGSQLAIGLDASGHSVAIIDKDRNAFRRLPERFAGRVALGSGFDRDVLEQARIREAGAFAAVTSGDNSNIVAARIARETYEIPNVVARIYDPLRAEIYQRLGIPTVATVTWTTDQVMRRLFPDKTVTDWADPSGAVQLVERDLPASWAGHKLDGLDGGESYRLVALTRAGQARLVAPGLVGQENDVLHLMVRVEAIEQLESRLDGGPDEAGGHK